jgi:hypothetical protein
VTYPFARRLFLSIDADGYSRANHPVQSAVQDELLDMLAAAAEAVGQDRLTGDRQGQGDEEPALIPPSEPAARVVDDVDRELATSLYWSNCDRAAGQRLRLRLALDHGPVQVASNGLPGRDGEWGIGIQNLWRLRSDRLTGVDEESGGGHE